MMTYPIEDHLPEVRADTLVIRGEFDAVAPRDWVRRVGELLPSSRLWDRRQSTTTRDFSSKFHFCRK